ncbi:MAG: hypothetical protein GX579_08815 [Chloroflexi bacterium]|nr:hypothetical protein [Chloroflexota bacterium]
MTIAELHGKSPFNTSEDFLTAGVFTAFRYLPPEPGLVSFLCSVPGLGAKLPASGEVEARLHFWPLGALLRREPDLLIELKWHDRRIHVVVEAKYFAGPSDKTGSEFLLGDQTISIGRQLVDEFLDLQNGYYTVFRDGIRDCHIALDSKPGDRYLLYLTAHPVRPDAELTRALSDHPEMLGSLHWTNWHHVLEHFQALRLSLTEFPYVQILADICLLLERKGFFTFHGFHPPVPIPRTNLDHVFWLDRRPGQRVFSGFARHPVLGLSNLTSVFWQARSNNE